MADFWIKLEKNTPDKPEIFEIAEILGIDPDAVLGKLIRVWCWLDSNSEDGHIKSVTSVLIDRVTMSQGFADAMKTVGWLDDNHIPNFDRHLGESAKKRAKDAERKRMSRNKSEDSHKKTVTESGLDKSRVDKSRIDINNTQADAVIDYLNAKAKTNFQHAETSRKIIRARLKKYKQSDLFLVIDKKTTQWMGSDMEKYLRPSTLFNETKFENYLNEKVSYENRPTQNAITLSTSNKTRERTVSQGLTDTSWAN